jgi:hypothetical protein
MLEEMIGRLEKANASVAEQQAQIDQLRDLGRNAEQVLPQLETRLGEVEGRVAAARATLTSFSAYAPESWSAVAGNADTATERLGTARSQLDAAKAAVAAGTRDDAAVAARAAERAIGEADALLGAITETDTALKDMQAKLVATLMAVQADVAKADAAAAAGQTTSMGQQLVESKAALAEAQRLAALQPPDIAGASRKATEADALIDQVLEDQGRATRAAQEQIGLAATSIAQARAMVNGGMGGRRALTRLNEAETYLARANQLLPTDPVAATQAAQTADALADEAVAEAQSQVSVGVSGYGAGTMPPMEMPGTGGGGGGGLGNVITGMILGSMMGGGNRGGGWGGGGIGWGGGTGSGGFGGSRRSGGSRSGGSRSAGSRSGGGMRAGRRSGGGF